MAKIQKLTAREILDSRGNPTVKVYIELESGIRAEAAVPSGASTGKYEAHELRDGDTNRYRGKGVQKAVENVKTEIAEKLVGMDVFDQQAVDAVMNELDGTPNKSRLGANAILGASLAVCRAAASEKHVPLYRYIHDSFFQDQEMRVPVPKFNILNGGEHAKSSGLSIQEFKLIPDGVDKYFEQVRAGSEIFHAFETQLLSEGFSTGVGDEGGFSVKMLSNEAALESIVRAIKTAGYRLGEQISLDLDVAANSFYDEDRKIYHLMPEDVEFTRENLITLYREWIEKFPLISIEDGLSEEDPDGWAIMLEKLRQTKKDIVLVGDDLLVTNVKKLKDAIDKKLCNSVLVKVNQVGTLSETVDTITLAQKNNILVEVSHRSGETTDSFIADLSVACGAQYIKTGSLSRGERMCKYNRLLEIEDELAG